MNFTRRFLIPFFVFVLPSSLFAGFVIDLSDKNIFKIAVEKNVVTFFKRSEAALRMRPTALGVPTDSIVFEHDDHALINHYGLGVDGEYTPHTHVAFTQMGIVPPDLLNQLLIEIQLPDEERHSVMRAYAEYFDANPDNLSMADRPLRPGTRPVERERPLVQPAIQNAQEVHNWNPPSPPVSALIMFLIYLSVNYPATSHL